MMFILCFVKTKNELALQSLIELWKTNYNEKYPELGSPDKADIIFGFSIFENGNVPIFMKKVKKFIGQMLT